MTGVGGARATAEDERARIPHASGSGGEYDAVVDFDRVIRDPGHPTRAQGAFDPGDHLHLTPAGYKAVADTLDLARFRPR